MVGVVDGIMVRLVGGGDLESEDTLLLYYLLYK